MPANRRNFLIGSSLSLAAGRLMPVLAANGEVKTSSRAYTDWAAVRREFDLDPNYIHLGLFYLTSHPRPVREAIEKYRRQLDANPFVTVESSLFESPEKNMPLKVCNTIARYIGGDPNDIALTQNTTTGLALLYHGLPLREGDEVFTTPHAAVFAVVEVVAASNPLLRSLARFSKIQLQCLVFAAEKQELSGCRKTGESNTKIGGIVGGVDLAFLAQYFHDGPRIMLRTFKE